MQDQCTEQSTQVTELTQKAETDAQTIKDLEEEKNLLSEKIN